MKQYLYEVFQTSANNQCSDLTIALAMFLADARMGKQEYGPDGLDYEALHKDYKTLVEQEQDLRLFLGRHHQKLAEAFRTADRAVFDHAILTCVDSDLVKGEKAEQE